jgi:peptidyl-prolyl cis-trans isomerase D
MVLEGLIQDALILVEAENQGLKVTDAELSERIVQDPSFQNEGRFIGRQAYLQILADNALTPGQYEEQLRAQLLRGKLQEIITDGVLVSTAEVEEEYRRRNEKASLEYVVTSKDAFKEGIEVSDQDIASHFEANGEDYRLPTQRKIRYLTMSPQPFQPAVNVSEREIERHYNRNLHLYETPAQIRASHILLKTADKEVDEVRSRAEEVLAEVKSGADFAQLARKYSEDTSAEQGGDLQFFGRGDMVPEFEQAAFSLAVGEVSDLVQSPYGFHIIKVTDRQDPLARPLDTVRDEIRGALVQEKAQDMMGGAVESASEYLRSTNNLEGLAQQYELLTTKETPFFGQQDQIPELGGSLELRSLIFEHPLGTVSPAIRHGDNYIYFEVLEEAEPRIPPLEEIKEQVRKDILDDKAMELARARAEEVKSELGRARDPSATAQAAGLELKTTDSFYQGTQLPEAGRSAAIQEAAFSLEPGSFSDPLPTNTGYVVLRVTERTEFSPETLLSERDEFTEQLLAEKRQRVWAAYLQTLHQRYSVQVNRETLRRLTG